MLQVEEVVKLENKLKKVELKSDETYACVTKKHPQSHRISLPPIFNCADGITTDGNVANQTRFSPVELWPFTTSAEKTKCE